MKQNGMMHGSWTLDVLIMCGHNGIFSNMVEGYKHSIKYGNNSRMYVVGKGSVRLVFDGTTFLIQYVYYVLEEKGLSIHIKMKAIISIIHARA
ncbi:hypothetical protein CR513_34700, partial [Mucuna pruriens]